ncbi:MAG: thioredoxin, partial [Clostridia bacterium]|nr:thioredoxin [Clostridia bacterium]
FLVGITFLLVTSLVYGLFILGALNVMLFAAQLFWVRNVVAAIVIVLGIFSIKDYFIYKEGVSVSIPDSYKTKYYQQVRKVFYTKSIIPMIAATAAMALGIALIELPCTAGFPFIWTSIIAGLDLSPSQFVFLFAVYLTIYLIDELILFLLALIRMRTLKLTEESGLFLKLIAGSFMLVLGLVLLLKPEFMDKIFGILMAFGATFLIIVIMYLIRKLISFQSR